VITAGLKGRDFLRINDWEPDELLLVLSVGSEAPKEVAEVPF